MGGEAFPLRTYRTEHPSALDLGPRVPIVFLHATISLDQPPPGIGEHNQAVYGDLLGYTAADPREKDRQNHHSNSQW